MSKAVSILYLDLDGTVRHGKDQLGRFVNKPSDVVIFPEALQKIREWKLSGGRVVAITNQGGVALGFMPFEIALQTLIETQKLCNNLFDMMMMCVHHPEAKEQEMAVCWCRKPRIGNIVEAAVRLGHLYKDEYYPPHMALFIGDRPEDKACAEGAGVRFMDASEWRGH